MGHIVSLLVAFAPAVINPILSVQVKADGDEGSLLRVLGHMATNGGRIHFPALIALGGFGIAMVLTSDEVFGFGDAWVSLAFLVWLAIIGRGPRPVAAGGEAHGGRRPDARRRR